MKQYECDLCGYIYDEAAGDPDNGIAPGTKWEDLPADWVCPRGGGERKDSPARKKVSPAPVGRGTSFSSKAGIRPGREPSGSSGRALWAGPAAAGNPE